MTNSLYTKNNTNKTIKSINIRYTNVRDLTSWAVSSSYLLEDEKDNLLKNILFQKVSGIIYLKDAVNLPPNGDLKIYLWGEFNPYDWDESLSVDYDGGVAKIEYNKSFYGLKAIIAEYFFEILVFIIMTFDISENRAYDIRSQVERRRIERRKEEKDLLGEDRRRQDRRKD